MKKGYIFLGYILDYTKETYKVSLDTGCDITQFNLPKKWFPVKVEIGDKFVFCTKCKEIKMLPDNSKPDKLQIELEKMMEDILKD